MTNKYEYLKGFVRAEGEETKINSNNFYPVKQEQISYYEKKLGIIFPSELKVFYKEIGYGFLTRSYKSSSWCSSITNRVNHPALISEILLDGPESGLISPDAYESLLPGDLPFFEISDSWRLLFMKLYSDNPNAVWYKNIKIEDSFERFIWRLYYESPWFYDDIIQAHYAQKEG